MIKRLTHIALVLCIALSMQAQVVAPLGYGLPYTPEKISKFNNGIAAVYIDADDIVQLQIWNGDFWYALETPPLPLAGSNSMGYLEIKDLKQVGNNLYLLAEHTLDLMPNAPNFILQWDGSSWTNLSNSMVDNALVLHQLILQNNTLQLVGIFSGDTANYNILSFEDSEWDFKGNLITKNIVNDKFKSVVSAYNKTYVTGSFTDPGQGTVTLAEWNGNIWQNMSFPAFLGENASIGVFNDQLVVFGNNSFNDEKIKLRKGNSWEDITTGLEDYTIHEIKEFDQLGSELYAVGRFEDAENNTVNLMKYNGVDWAPVLSNVSTVNNAEFANGKLYVSGYFEDNKELNNVGQLYSDRALIVASAYNDKNGNCQKDVDEEYLVGYPLNLNNEIEFALTDKYGFTYFKVPEKEYSLNANTYSYWQPTCDDAELSVDEITAYTGYEFGVRKQANIKDAAIYIADNQSYVHQNGDLKRAKICVRNIGSEDITNASLKLSHNNAITNFASELAYNTYDGSNAEWIVTIPADGELCFYVEFKSVTDQDIELNTQVVLNNGSSDADETNNSATLKYKNGETLINEKHCNNGEAIKPDTEYMNYKIGFKNEGSRSAVDVMIVDVLDEDISISPKGIWYNYSHDCNLLPVDYVETNGIWQYKFIWEYKGINLPSAEETESEGFLDFKVYLRENSLSLGQEICNTAKIYFSFKEGSLNEPIYTNTVCSQVTKNGSVIPATSFSGIEVSPIPADQNIMIKNNTTERIELKLLNTIGQQLHEITVLSKTETSVDISQLPAGVYFLYSESIMVQKFVVH